MELYGRFSPMHKLFGYGPDTFGILTITSIYDEMVEATGQIFDSAHNEYLQFLLTIGPVGLAFYLVFQVTACRKMIKCWNKEQGTAAFGCVCAIICYAAQAVVNLNLPIVAPVWWVLLTIGVANARSIDQR